MKVTALNYMAGFRCLQSACPDNCCRYWAIPVDQRFYRRFSRRCLDAGTYGLHFQDRVYKVMSSATDIQYLLRLGDSGRCTYLRPDGLCEIQLTYGEEYLPDACALFPRITIRVDERLECAASFSCPEMGRRGLFWASGIRPESTADQLPRRVALVSPYLPDPGSYLLLRDCCLKILQYRRLTVADRISMLGSLITELGEDGLANPGLARLCSNYRRMARSGKWVRRSTPVPELHFVVTATLVCLRFSFVLDCPESHAFLSRAAAWTSGTGARSVDDYSRVWRNVVEPGLTHLGPVLENMLVNSVFKDCFLMPGVPYHDQFTDLVVRFLVFRFLLFWAAFSRNLDAESVVTTARIFSRMFDHHAHYLKRARHHLQNHSAESLGTILPT